MAVLLPRATCSTAAATTAKTATISNSQSFNLVDGQACLVVFTNAFSATTSGLTLDINSTGAKQFEIGNYIDFTKNGSSCGGGGNGTYRHNQTIPANVPILIIYINGKYIATNHVTQGSWVSHNSCYDSCHSSCSSGD